MVHVDQFARLLAAIHSQTTHNDYYASLFSEKKFFESLRLDAYYHFASEHVPEAREFLHRLSIETGKENVCLVTDIKMKGMSGLDLQKKLNNRRISLPVIFLTAFDSDSERKQAQTRGAAAFFRKPIDDSALIDAIKWAVR